MHGRALGGDHENEDLFLDAARSEVELTTGPLSETRFSICRGRLQIRRGLCSIEVDSVAQISAPVTYVHRRVRFEAIVAADTTRQAVALTVVTPNLRLVVPTRCVAWPSRDGGIGFEMTSAGFAPQIDDDRFLTNKTKTQRTVGVLRLHFEPATHPQDPGRISDG